MKTLAALAVALGLTALALPASAATQITLHLPGLSTGGTGPAAGDEMDVLRWSWGVSFKSSVPLRVPRDLGRVGRKRLGMRIEKAADRSTPDLFLAVANGRHFPEATLTVRETGPAGEEIYVVLMTDVRLAEVAVGGSGSEDRLTENLTLDFAEVQVVWTPRRDDGSLGPPVEYGFDAAPRPPRRPRR